MRCCCTSDLSICWAAVQVLGIFSVVATATGCLYFVDQQEVATSTGLNVTAVLLSILNLVFVTLVLSLMLKKSSTHIKLCALWLKSCCFKHAQLDPEEGCELVVSRTGSTVPLHSRAASDIGSAPVC